MIDTFYVNAPRTTSKNRRRYGGERLIGPGVMTRVAELYESGWKAPEIAFSMQLPRTAVDDIIATYEHRAERYFKIIAIHDFSTTRTGK